jgi:excisionase family DNA binding protein
MNNIEPIYYTIEEVAKILKVHENTIYNWVESGKLQAIKIGNLWRIPRESLPQVVENNK